MELAVTKFWLRRVAALVLLVCGLANMFTFARFFSAGAAILLFSVIFEGNFHFGILIVAGAGLILFILTAISIVHLLRDSQVGTVLSISTAAIGILYLVILYVVAMPWYMLFHLGESPNTLILWIEASFYLASGIIAYWTRNTLVQ